MSVVDVAFGKQVEVAGRLVGEQHGGLVHERPGDGDALLLAAGKLARLFFFSSRRRHTSFSRDCSSDVCSSDLLDFERAAQLRDALKWLDQLEQPQAVE